MNPTQEQQNNNLSNQTTSAHESATYALEPRERTTKWLAVAGFLALLIAMAWFIFTAMSFVPHLVATVGNFLTAEDTVPTPVELILTPATTEAEHNQPITLEWEPAPEAGSYAIWFACVDGVRIQVATPNDGAQEINCATFYNIGNLTAIRTTFLSEQAETTAIEYQVAFLPEADPDNQSTTSGVLTIRNQTLALAEDTEVSPETPAEEEEDVVAEPSIPDASVPEPTTPTQPVYREEIVYSVPQSDPAGTTDLAVTYRGVGVIESSTFIAGSRFTANDRGAIRFAVTNRGTRTSETWRYTAELPNGQTFTSPEQAPLRPNETATISLGFRAPAEAGTFPFAVNITTVRDQDRSNHAFAWNVKVD